MPAQDGVTHSKEGPELGRAVLGLPSLPDVPRDSRSSIGLRSLSQRVETAGVNAAMRGLQRRLELLGYRRSVQDKEFVQVGQIVITAGVARARSMPLHD